MINQPVKMRKSSSIDLFDRYAKFNLVRWQALVVVTNHKADGPFDLRLLCFQFEFLLKGYCVWKVMNVDPEYFFVFRYEFRFHDLTYRCIIR
jgi:hypothetical protein